MTENDKPNEALQKLKPHFLKTEIMLVTIALVGITFKFYHVNAGNMLVITSMGLLSVLYIFSAFLQDEVEYENAEDIMYARFVNKLTGFACAIIVVGILFSLMHWPGQKSNFYLGTGALVAALLVNVLKLKNMKPVPKIVLFIALGLGSLYLPETKPRSEPPIQTTK